MDRVALEKMLAQGDDNLLLRYSLGTLYLKEGMLESAAENLRQALSKDPKHSASWKNYAKTLMKLGRNQDAMQAYESGISVAREKGDLQAAKEMEVFLKRLKNQEKSD